MLQLIGSGNLTRDAELRQAGDSQVCSVGVAINKKVKGEEKVTFIDLSIWGDRGAKLKQYLTRGKRVFFTGEFETREHEGKTYYQCRVAELDFGGGPAAGDGSKQKSDGADDNDNIPF